MRISDWSSDVCSSDLADQSADDRAAQEVDLAAPGRREGLRQAKAARGGGDLQVAVRRRHHVDEDGHAIETDERGDHLDATQQRPRAEGEANVGRNLGKSDGRQHLSAAVDDEAFQQAYLQIGMAKSRETEGQKQEET